MISRILPLLNAKPLLSLAWIVVLGVLLLLAADSFIGKPSLDSSTYIYVAEGILKGELPYVDRWDNKGPLLYSLNAIGISSSTTPGAFGWCTRPLLARRCRVCLSNTQEELRSSPCRLCSCTLPRPLREVRGAG